MNDKLLKLNQPGQIVELTKQEAEELGAFEESPLSEQDALDAIETEQEA